MSEAEFLAQAEPMLARIETLLEQAAETADVDLDLEPQEGGILKLEFENGSQIIINRHVAAREIWVAARSGGFHFKLQDGEWVGTRDGRELLVCIEELASQQAGVPIRFAR